jgi:hypothetical protein
MVFLPSGMNIGRTVYSMHKVVQMFRVMEHKNAFNHCVIETRRGVEVKFYAFLKFRA